MKKILFLTKTLLAVALLCVGQNAWGDDEYTAVYTRAAVGDWVESDKTDWSASSAVEVNATNGLGANANQAATYVNKSFAIGSNSKVKYVVDWTFATATGRTNNWNWIQFGNFFRIGVNSSYNVTVSTDAGTNWNETSLGYYYNQTKTARIIVIFDTATNTIETFSFDGTDRTTLVSGVFSDKTYNSVSTGFVRGGSVSWTLNNYITTISVSQLAQAVTNVNYTINYQLSGTTVKTVEGTSVVGAEITADATIDGTEEGYVGNHYLITAADAPSMTLVADAASNVLNVPVRAPYTATLNVTKTIGGVAQTPVVTNLVETDAKVCSWNYTYPMYVQKDGVYYVADNISSFGESGNFTNGETINKTVAYTNPDYSVVYFGEPNEVTGTNTAYSNGATGYITGGVSYGDDKVIRLGQLQAGTYRLITNITGDANRNLVVGDYTSGTASFPTALVTISTTGAKDESFTVDGTQLISISGKDQGNSKFNQSATLDYILVKAVSKSITPANTKSTYVTTAALDFTDVEGLDAYVATEASNGTVTLNEVGAVPTGTPLILVGTAGTEYTVPVVASASGPAVNMLRAGDGTTAFNGSTYDYILYSDGLFYQIGSGTVATNKAYLHCDSNPTVKSGSSPVRSLRIVFDGITGVDNVEAAAEAKAQDGKFIENGKIVIVKNGVKYNAAGQQVK